MNTEKLFKIILIFILVCNLIGCYSVKNKENFTVKVKQGVHNINNQMEKFGQKNCKIMLEKYWPMGLFYVKHTDKICKDSEMKKDFLNMIRASELDLKCPKSTPTTTSKKEQVQSEKQNNQIKPIQLTWNNKQIKPIQLKWKAEDLQASLKKWKKSYYRKEDYAIRMRKYYLGKIDKLKEKIKEYKEEIKEYEKAFTIISSSEQELKKQKEEQKKDQKNYMKMLEKLNKTESKWMRR